MSKFSRQMQQWTGLPSWRSPAAPLNERRRWGIAGPEKVAAPPELGLQETPQSLAEWGALIFATPHPLSKALFTHHAYKLWRSRTLSVGAAAAVESPARPDKPHLVHPRKVPTAKVLGISPSVHMMHNLAHIELNAVDLAWDTVVRFSGSSGSDRNSLRILLTLQMTRAGIFADCQKTSESVDARLAVIPMVQEARGLDAGPRLVERLTQLGDDRSAGIVKQISEEELAHVAVGVSWFLKVCKRLDCDPAARFKDLLTSLNVELRGPFNHEAREAAGLPQSWYDSTVHSNSAKDDSPLSDQKDKKDTPSCLPEASAGDQLKLLQVYSRLALVISSESDNLR